MMNLPEFMRPVDAHDSGEAHPRSSLSRNAIMPIVTPEAPVDTTWTSVDQTTFDAFLASHPAAITAIQNETTYPNELKEMVTLTCVSYYLTDSSGEILLAQSNTHTPAEGSAAEVREPEYLLRTALLPAK